MAGLMSVPLITQDERHKLQTVIGARQTVVAAAIARLHLASPDPRVARKPPKDSILRTFKNLSNEEWTTTNVVGALVLIIDRAVDALVFQIYDLKTFSLRFSYELYLDINYEVLNAQFHAIEIEDAVAGFCFADQGEARTFLSKVMALRPTSKSNAGANLLRKEKKGLFGGIFGGGSSKSKGRESLRIGQVRMLQHNQHVGVNADGTFDVNHLNPQWKQLFKQAGVRKKDLENPETAAAIMATIQQAERQQQVTVLYQQDPDYEDLTEDQIGDAVEELSEEELAAYAKYEEEMRQYYADLAAYEAEQTALQAWEDDNQSYIAAQEAEQARAAAAQIEEDSATVDEDEDFADDEGDDQSSTRRSTNKQAAPPPLPPRRELKKANKELRAKEKEAQVQAKAAAEAEKTLHMAVNNYRASLARVRKSPEEEEAERAAEKAREDAEKARHEAEEAAAERDRIMAEIAELRAKNEAARMRLSMAKSERTSRRISLSLRKSKAKPPPLPTSKPPMAFNRGTPPNLPPPPPPPLPVVPPAPPPMPELPPLPALAAIPEDEDEETVQSTPPTPRFALPPPPPKPITKKPSMPAIPRANAGLLAGIQQGVDLRRVGTPSVAPRRTNGSGKALPDLGAMKPKAQNQLMAKLIETMNERRAAMSDSDSEDEWSD
mmetsp:Transcript_22300/g.43756  ORF Transcript_22300/g.43756 Transcript_22300/m.43756 type:complete len:663 (-) Transcript_22300:751-2739(-)